MRIEPGRCAIIARGYCCRWSGKVWSRWRPALAPDRAPAKHQSLQQLITDAPWRDEPVLKVAREYGRPALERHGGVEATVVDETGIPKQGRHSVGVARQYCGQLGKVCNCQVAVSLANSWASLPIAWQLYLPREWAEDEARRTKAGVPQEIRFRTKRVWSWG